MFAVEPYPAENRPWPLQFTKERRKWVVDHERNLYLVILDGIGRAPGWVYLLGDGQNTIPFATRDEWRDTPTDPLTGERFQFTRICSFGSRLVRATESRGWFLPHTFIDDDDKAHWLRIAAEATLVCGFMYNGMDYKDGYFRVELDGQLLRLSDFGYTPRGIYPQSL
jgi:hypothetical protein